MTTAGRRFGIFGAATAALGAAIAGSVSNLVMDEPTSARPRRQNGVTWGQGRMFLSKRKPGDHSQLTNEQRKRYGLPHDGAKQAEKDRRRAVWMNEYYDARFTDEYGWTCAIRPSPIIEHGGLR